MADLPKSPSIADLTNQATHYRELSEQMGDIEFVNAIKTQLGPYGRNQVDADRASLIGTNTVYTHKGIYIPHNPAQSEKDKFQPAFDDSRMGQEQEEDTVYAFNGQRAGEDLWAHEFRHREHRTNPENAAIYDDLGEERSNLLWDAHRARTPQQWKDVVRVWKGHARQANGLEYMSDAEAERSLLKQLEEKADMIRKTELDAMDAQGEVAPKEGWFRWDDQNQYWKNQRDQREAATQRPMYPE